MAETPPPVGQDGGLTGRGLPPYISCPFPAASRMMPPALPDDTISFLRDRAPASPRVALVLGSGLGGLADEIADPVRIAYREVPGFAGSSVAGHAGALVFGTLQGVPVAALQGRFHLYEGVSASQAVLPVRALAALGARALVVTNAAGGIRPGMKPGELMLISDHLNLLGVNPLVGAVLPGEQRFPDMSGAYDPALRREAMTVAAELGLSLSEGVYAAVLGPSYETPAEIRMLARLGADAVGMSTVPETIAARARGMRVLGISCITNVAAGLGDAPLSHDEVLGVGAEVGDRLAALVRGVLPRVAA